MLLPWIESHHLTLGLFADTLTFAGAAILARDAFSRMAELTRRRTRASFEEQFPALDLTDEEWRSAVRSTRWAYVGFLALSLGFLFQLFLRASEV